MLGRSNQIFENQPTTITKSTRRVAHDGRFTSSYFPMLWVRLVVEFSYASSPLVPFLSRAQYGVHHHDSKHSPEMKSESTTTKNPQSLPVIILFSSMSFAVADPNGAPNHHTSSHWCSQKSLTGYVPRSALPLQVAGLERERISSKRTCHIITATCWNRL